MVWINIEAIKVVIELDIQVFGVTILILTVVTLLVSRVLIWASTGLLAQNCADVGRKYNAIMAERKRRN